MNAILYNGAHVAMSEFDLHEYKCVECGSWQRHATLGEQETIIGCLGECRGFTRHIKV
jgi:hypothetical protein